MNLCEWVVVDYYTGLGQKSILRIESNLSNVIFSLFSFFDLFSVDVHADV